MNRLGHSENARFELTETQSGYKKEPIKEALNSNGGKNASYIEPFIKTLKEQLMNKDSSRLICMLNHWASKYVA